MALSVDNPRSSAIRIAIWTYVEITEISLVTRLIVGLGRTSQ